MTNLKCIWVFGIVSTLTWMSPLCRAADDSRIEGAKIQGDCLPFNLNNASVALTRDRWKIVDGDHWMFDFGNQEQQARRALEIIHFYRMDSTCFAGRPNPPMVYLLASRKAPEGSMPGEQCEAFDAANLTLLQSGQFWQILSANHTLFDFGNKEVGAKNGILALHHYGFSYKCVVGPTDSSFRYLRR